MPDRAAQREGGVQIDQRGNRLSPAVARRPGRHPIRAKLRWQHALKLTVRSHVERAFTRMRKQSPCIYPALMLALHAGMRDAEIRGLQWGRVDLKGAMVTVGDSTTEAGEGRTIPLNSDIKTALVDHAC